MPRFNKDIEGETVYAPVETSFNEIQEAMLRDSS